MVSATNIRRKVADSLDPLELESEKVTKNTIVDVFGMKHPNLKYPGFKTYDVDGTLNNQLFKVCNNLKPSSRIISKVWMIQNMTYKTMTKI